MNQNVWQNKFEHIRKIMKTVKLSQIQNGTSCTFYICFKLEKSSAKIVHIAHLAVLQTIMKKNTPG